MNSSDFQVKFREAWDGNPKMAHWTSKVDDSSTNSNEKYDFQATPVAPGRALSFLETGVCSSGTNSLKPMRNRGCTWLGNYIIKPQHKGPKAGKPESFLSVVCGARPPRRVNSDCLKTCESYLVVNDFRIMTMKSATVL